MDGSNQLCFMRNGNDENIQLAKCCKSLGEVESQILPSFYLYLLGFNCVTRFKHAHWLVRSLKPCNRDEISPWSVLCLLLKLEWVFVFATSITIALFAICYFCFPLLELCVLGAKSKSCWPLTQRRWVTWISRASRAPQGQIESLSMQSNQCLQLFTIWLRLESIGRHVDFALYFT